VIATYRKHLVGLVKHEHLHGIGLEEATLDHVVDTAGSSDNDLGAVLEGLHVITNAGAANAGVALNVHEVADGDNDLLDLLGKLASGGENESLALLDVGVELLEDGDGESGSLASSGLGLSNNVVAWGALATSWVWVWGENEVIYTLDDRHDGALLDSRGALETIGVDA